MKQFAFLYINGREWWRERWTERDGEWYEETGFKVRCILVYSMYNNLPRNLTFIYIVTGMSKLTIAKVYKLSPLTRNESTSTYRSIFVHVVLD